MIITYFGKMNNLTLKLIIILTFFSFYSSNCSCQSIPKLSDKNFNLQNKKLVESIKQYCDAQFKNKSFNGNILVAKHGRIIFQESYGYADLKSKTALNPNNTFNICSISKEFAAVAIMLCKERNLLSLDDTLRKFFPDLPYNGITIRHLLTHTSGIVSTEFIYKEWSSEKMMTQNDLLNMLLEKKPQLMFSPGKKFEYSNIPYMLLALIIEKVSGQTYADFLQQNIFDKLEMNHTSIGQSDKYAGLNTSDYIYDFVNDSAESKTYFRPYERPDYKKAILIYNYLYGNSNIYSTTNDLLKWQNALIKGKLVNESDFNTMVSPIVEANFAGIQYYGYGFSVNYVYGDTMIFHNGGTLCYSTTLRYLRNLDITIITLANTNRNNDPVESIMGIIYKQEVVLPSANTPIKLTPNELNSYAGTYQLGDRQFTIEIRNDSLFRVIEGSQPIHLIPKKGNRLFYSDGSDRELLFRNENGKIKVYLVKPEGLLIQLNKL